MLHLANCIILKVFPNFGPEVGWQEEEHGRVEREVEIRHTDEMVLNIQLG